MELSKLNKILDTILEHGMRLEYKIKVDHFKLCNAIIKNDIESAKFLITQAKDINFTTLKIENPLKIAVIVNKLPMAELLLKSGANPNQDRFLKKRIIPVFV